MGPVVYILSLRMGLLTIFDCRFYYVWLQPGVALSYPQTVEPNEKMKGNNNKTQAYVLIHLGLSDLWLRGFEAYLNRQIEVRKLQVTLESI